MKFRKKPVVIEAIQFTGVNGKAVHKWAQNLSDPHVPMIDLTEDHKLIINTLEGKLYCSEGDWVICGIEKEFYPCKPDIFEKTYEPVE